jgi:predicted nucleotidyltransferase
VSHPTVTAREVVARRRAERHRLLDRAALFAQRLDPGLGVRAVVVFGSVARGDFNVWSDIDVLVVAEHLPAEYRDRLDAIGWPPPSGVEPVVWTPREYRRQRERGNPIAVEAEQTGVWLVGAPRRPGRAGSREQP